MVDATIAVGAVVLTFVAVLAGIFVVRHRLAWRIATRNVRRARARTVLLLLGLLVGTTIISGSLIVGSTVNNLETHYTYVAGGNVHEGIYATGPTGAYVPFPYGTYTELAQATTGYPNIAGITPMVVGTAEVYDERTGIPETALNLIASNGNQSANLGEFTTTSGSTSAGPGAGQSFIDVQTAEAINASVGDRLIVYGAAPIETTVAAIVADDVRGGYLTAGIIPGNVFLDLANGQGAENLSGQINFIAVTNTGGQQGGVGLSGTVSAYLNSTLAHIPSASGLTVNELLESSVASAQSAGSDIQTIFLVLGLFSILAGAVLIVGIFLMLAEERKGEMGMLRAIGMQQRELVHVYFFEGLIYAVGSALAGTLLGIVVGYGLTIGLSGLLSLGTLTSTAIIQSFTVTPDDVVVSYVAGFLLTVITVALASFRASRLNIVEAIRDIPASPPPVRFYTTLSYVGAGLAVLGALVLIPNAHGTSDMSIPLLGGALMIIGAGLFAARFVGNRIAFTALGVALLAWAGYPPLRQAVLGTAHTGAIFIVFTEGILMIAAALILYGFNSVSITNALLRLAGAQTRGAPVARIAFSYPARRAGRTVLTLTIFALVTFTMVAIACFGATVQANLNNTVQTESGGYSFFGFSTQPIPDLPQRIANNTTLARDFSVAVPLVTGSVEVNVSGQTPNPYGDSLFAAPVNQTPADSFYATNGFSFYETWDGLTRSQVLDELATNDSVAIVDGNYAPPTATLAGTPLISHPRLSPGTFIELSSPGSASVMSVRVIGILTERVLTGVWVNPATASRLGYTSEVGYLLTVRPGVSTTTAAQDAKRAFFPEGLVLFDITALFQVGFATTEGFIGLLEIFVGLGLVVGIAAVGIFALRAVVERRREIGMERAMGFTHGDVLRSFFLEYSFISLLGLAIGTVLGIWIVYDLSVSPTAASEGVSYFAVPVVNIAVILLAAYALSMLAVTLPAVQASRLPPAEAVRPTE